LEYEILSDGMKCRSLAFGEGEGGDADKMLADGIKCRSFSFRGKRRRLRCTLSNKKCPFSDTFCLGQFANPLPAKGLANGMVVEKKDVARKTGGFKV
jgi:hypothetical protein